MGAGGPVCAGPGNRAGCSHFEALAFTTRLFAVFNLNDAWRQDSRLRQAKSATFRSSGFPRSRLAIFRHHPEEPGATHARNRSQSSSSPISFAHRLRSSTRAASKLFKNLLLQKIVLFAFLGNKASVLQHPVAPLALFTLQLFQYAWHIVYQFPKFGNTGLDFIDLVPGLRFP